MAGAGVGWRRRRWLVICGYLVQRRPHVDGEAETVDCEVPADGEGADGPSGSDTGSAAGGEARTPTFSRQDVRDVWRVAAGSLEATSELRTGERGNL